MILQPNQDQKNENAGKYQMNEGKSNENGIELIMNIFRHRGNLLDNNEGKNKINKRTSNKKYFLGN